MYEIDLDYTPDFQELAGANDKNLHRIEKQFGVRIHARGDKLRISGEREGAEMAQSLLSQLFDLMESGVDVNNGALKFIIPAFYDDPSMRLGDMFSEKINLTTGRREIIPRSIVQKEYVFAMSRFDVVIATGPAGTGKTYLAMASAVNDLLRKRVARIILTRPAVEAGERLGFLPGDLYEKINPYLRPLYDALFDMLDADHVRRLTEQGQIEIAPLAYMRGRTLNDAFIILDEAQNATPDQIKMLLTRLGINSKTVITGDVTQVDLPAKKDSGLIHDNKILKDVSGIRLIHFSEKDVVRHEMVKRILQAYEADEERGAASPPAGGDRDEEAPQ